MRRTPRELLDMIEAPGFELYDQWEAQTQAIVQTKADVHLYSSLDPQTVRDAMLTPVVSIEETLAELLGRYGHDARIAVLPEGPQTVPFVREAVA